MSDRETRAALSRSILSLASRVASTRGEKRRREEEEGRRNRGETERREENRYVFPFDGSKK